MPHVPREIEKLKSKVLALSLVIQENFHKAIKTLEQLDPNLGKEVIELDRNIDETEVEIEEDCLKVLALHQPVANDLRFIVAVLKMNNDLERIGDLAVNIARRAIRLSEFPDMKANLPDFTEISEKVQSMLQRSLMSLMNLNSKLAYDVCRADREVDALYRRMYKDLIAEMKAHPQWLEPLLEIFGVVRILERIADHTTNISEDVIYLIEGDIIRHQAGKQADLTK